MLQPLPEPQTKNGVRYTAPICESLDCFLLETGPIFGPLLGQSFLLKSMSEATSVWRWSNFLHRRAPAGRRVVRLNLDETSIRLHQGGKPGLVRMSARVLKRSARSLTTPASTTQTCGMFTLVTIVCDDAAIQNVLPQVLLVNETRLSKFEPAANLRQMLDAHTALWVVNTLGLRLP